MTHPISMNRLIQLHCRFGSTLLITAAMSSGCAGADDTPPAAETAQQPIASESPMGEKASDPSLVKVATGYVRGNVGSGYRQFFGIPYAAPPTGSMRWKPPAPAPSWRGVRDASVPKEVCPQYVYTARGVAHAEGDEDCLHLNVTTPNKSNQKRLPVMVWIHGGEYTNGSGLNEDPTGLVQKAEVIVVTLNYRLGALGFLAHPALTAESRDTSGNFGLLDQQAALAWVKANIAQFGGDPTKVTLFGVSAGGNSVWAHMISPKSADLFQRAISISGLWSSNWNWMGYDEPAQPFARADAETTGKRFAEALGCSGSNRVVARCLRNSTVADLVETGGADVGPMFFKWGPTAGGAVIPRQLKDALTIGAFNRVPIINGATHDESVPYVMMSFWIYMNNPLTPEIYAQTLERRFGSDASAVQAAYPVETYGSATYAYGAVDTDLQNSCYTRTITQLAAEFTKVYAYEFNDPNAPNSYWAMVFGGPLPYAPKAFHASDLPYVFRSLDNVDNLSAEQLRLSDSIIEYYATFAKSGTPQGMTSWFPYHRRVDAVQSFAPDAITPIPSFATDHQCAFWARLRGI